MSAIDSTTPTRAMPPPVIHQGVVGWLRASLFSSPLNILLTVLVGWLLLMIVPALIDWLFIKSDFNATTAKECRASGGACWAFIAEKHRFILFGIYPYDEQWRPLLAMIILIAVLAISAMRRFWRPILGPIWLLALTAVAVLMWGGVFGLTHVENSHWGGLPLTLILATFGIALAFPFGLILALGRRSNLPAVRTICIVYIELIRGVPLISLLFMSSVMLPLFLPEGMNFDKLLRALIGVILFQSAYVAEVVRGGLQAIPKGQYEAAAAMGLGYWRSMGLVILPQALKLVIPGIVNTFIALFKDTSLVIIIGLFDLLNSVKQAAADPKWLGMATEGYVFAALVFWIFCFGMSRYSMHLEHKLDTGHKR